MNPIKVTAVSYLNTKPFLFGLLHSKLRDRIDLQLDIPSVCAEKLSSGVAALGLVPVGAIPDIPNPQIISDYCIGTEGAVRTVCIYSHCPIEEMTHLILDYHSRTSVALTKILLKEYWQADPILVPGFPGFEQKIEYTRGALVIGDRAIGLEKKYSYVYDLGEIWEKHTGLPFVFAAWITTRPLSPGFLKDFNEALRAGIETIPQLLFLLNSPDPAFDLREYFTRHISYPFDEAKKQALKLFLEKMRALQPQAGYQQAIRI